MLAWLVESLYLETMVERFLRDQVKQQLLERAKVVLAIWELDREHWQDNHLDELIDKTSPDEKVRISIIDHEGMVIADSLARPERLAELGDHSDRPEVVEARRNGIGSSLRYSDTWRQELIYSAVVNKVGEQGIVVRAATPYAYVHASILQIRTKMLWGGALALLLVILTTLVVSSKLADKISLAMRELTDALGRKKQQLDQLQELSNLLAVCQSRRAAGQIIGSVAPLILEHQYGAVSLYLSNSKELTTDISWGREKAIADVFTSDACWALQKGTAHTYSKRAGGIGCSHFIGKQPLNSICIPLVAQGDILGVFLLGRDAESEFTQEEAGLAGAIAEHLGMALSSIEMREQLQEQATRDALTGVYNRRYFDQAIESELSRSRRQEEQFALVYFDIDLFKQVNDRYGHDGGDYVLRAIAMLVSSIIRTEDSLCRIGGEEFVLLLPETGTESAREMAERVRQSIANQELRFGSVNLESVTISAGLAVFPRDGGDADSLIKVADSALYEAKHAGRNQVRPLP